MAATSDEESNSPADLYVQRVSQLDAGDLDDELHCLLKEQVTKAFKYVKPRYWSVLDPELDAILKLILLTFSVSSFHATVGQRLLNIKYRDVSVRHGIPSHLKLMVYVLGMVIAHWVKSREDHVTMWLRRWPKCQSLVIKARLTFSWSEGALRTAMLINSLWFLVEGKYSSLVERLLRLKPVPAFPQNTRQVSYEYLNRELLWHGFAEFLTFVIPLLNVRRLINFVCRRMPMYAFVEPTGPSKRTRADFMECAICEQSPTLPHEIGCSHVFCYYCIASNVDIDPNFRCPKCGLQVKLDDPIKCIVIE